MKFENLKIQCKQQHELNKTLYYITLHYITLGARLLVETFPQWRGSPTYVYFFGSISCTLVQVPRLRILLVVMRSCPLTLHFSQISDSNAATKKSISLTTSSESTTIIVWDVAFLKSWLYLVNTCCTCFVWTSRRSVILSSSCWQVGWPVADWYLLRKPQFRPLFRCQHGSLFWFAFHVFFFPVVSVCVAVSAVESVENKFSRLSHRFVSAEEANTAFLWCQGIPLTHLAQSLAQKPH